MVDQFARAATAWPILTDVARRRDRIEYGELACRLGIHVRPLRYVLSVIQDYCIAENLPPLTILVVNKAGRQGRGFIAWDAADAESGFHEVWNHQWNTQNPFAGVDGRSTEATLLGMLANASAATVWRRVQDRGVRQLLFRRALVSAYSGRCAVSGCTVPEALDAAHIVPWASCEPADRLSPSNGLLLTTFHHRLFDRGIITIDEEYRVRVLRRRPKRIPPAEKSMLWNFEGRRLFLPRGQRLWPDPRLILQRNRALGFTTRAV